jgi:hypothetical protein
MQKQIYKIFFSIFLSPIFLFIFMNNSIAFLDSDLWLNLYENLDSWLKDFEDKQYIYELSGKDKKGISEKINELLKKEWINYCFKSWINVRIIDSITNWDINILVNYLKKEEKCWYNTKTEKFDLFNNEGIWKLVNKISEIKSKYQKKAEQKAKAIYEISRIWIYSDWSIKNSPFDLIKDIQDIDKIIFSEDIEYQWDDNSFLNKLLKKEEKKAIVVSPNKNNTIDSWEVDNNTIDSWEVNNNIIDSWKIKNNSDDKIVEDSYLELDWNSYVCKTRNNLESWLSIDSLSALENSLNSISANDDNGVSFNFNYWGWWHIKLPNSNKINIPDLKDTDSFSWLWSYNKINDNDSWECNKSFCIIVNFVVSKHNALGYGIDKSIENVLKTSNKHLKKAVSTSLVQSKMSTNNFEMTLRDLDLPLMFHIWIIITKKTPPILYLENILWKSEENKISESSDFVNNMLTAKYKSFWLNYDSANNINNFLHKEEELSSIINSLENPSTRVESLVNEFWQILNLRALREYYEENELSKNINNGILKEFDIEFTELEQFSSNILNYVTNIDTLVKKLKEIPTYNW